MKSGRRHIFQILAAAMATVAVHRRAAAAVGTPLESIRSMEVIGRAYLAEYGASGIAAALAQDPSLGNSQSGQNCHMLLRRVAQDFTDGNTVLVSGWMLSCAEARVCAVAALRSAASNDQ